MPGGVVGFALARFSASEYELDALFVDPDLIGSGIGRRLIEDALERMAAVGGQRLVIEADSHAQHTTAPLINEARRRSMNTTIGVLALLKA